MADEDGIYGGEDHDRFEAEEFDQDYVDGGIREDVSLALTVSSTVVCNILFNSLFTFTVGSARCY